MSAASLLGAVGSNGHDSEDGFYDDQGDIDDTDEDSDIENEPDARWRSKLLSIKSCMEWRVNTTTAPKGYAVRLGKALTSNTRVWELDLDLGRNRLLLQDEADISYSQGVAALAPLLTVNYLRNARLLGRISIHRCGSVFASECVEAIGSNPYIRYLNIAGGPMKLNLSTAIRSASSLRELVMTSCFDHTRSEMVANALGENQTLQKLSLQEFNPTEMRDVLRGLRSNNRLTCLELWLSDMESTATVHEALESYLLHTTSLNKLSFRYFSFRVKRLRGLFHSLAANLSVTVLDFQCCSFTQRAVLAENLAPLRCIRTLSVSDLDDEEGFGVRPPAVINTLVRQFPSLEKLSWYWDLYDRNIQPHDMDCFWNDLRASAALRSLKNLKLWNLSSGGYAAMNSCLPELTSLRHLESCLGDFPRAQVAPFVKAVRKNGSLHQVSIGEEGPRVWKRKEERILRAALQRNVQLPRLLAVGAAPSRNTRETRASANASTQHSQRFPTLFLSAMQTPRMSPNHVLSGLQTLGEPIAPRGGSGAKRSLGVK